tara:strand:- start:15736 stop:16005 length:270 start_codon:yes stop_codon:yes gene_type:complete
MKKPVKGMKTTPNGINNPILMGAWFSCVSASVGVEGITKSFKDDTGIDITILVNRSPIEKLIDEATGLDKDIAIKWCDWVTKNIWGEQK